MRDGESEHTPSVCEGAAAARTIVSPVGTILRGAVGGSPGFGRILLAPPDSISEATEVPVGPHGCLGGTLDSSSGLGDALFVWRGSLDRVFNSIVELGNVP